MREAASTSPDFAWAIAMLRFPPIDLRLTIRKHALALGHIVESILSKFYITHPGLGFHQVSEGKPFPVRRGRQIDQLMGLRLHS